MYFNKYSLSSFHFFSLSLKYWGIERGGEGVDGRMCGHADVLINSNAIDYLGPSIEKVNYCQFCLGVASKYFQIIITTIILTIFYFQKRDN